MKIIYLILSLVIFVESRYNEYIHTPHLMKNNVEYSTKNDLPQEFSWKNVNGTSYITKTLNQHIPQYCGSCWAHGALSAFADRIKIARNAQGADIDLSIQFILNCGKNTAGSCYGGSHHGAYKFIQGYGSVPYDTCQPYLACSSNSREGFCGNIKDYTTCEQMNICKTCSSFL